VGKETLSKIYTQTYKNDYGTIKTAQEIYNTVTYLYSATDGLACCKTGWYRTSKEAAGTQTRRTGKKGKDITKDEWTIVSRTRGIRV
jgi:hypothetical protein